ncbi:MAG: recombination protein RecR [Flavobacteriales bacterium]|nr:recombination protein RecR [Flavobacteriales bacterium]
MEHSSKYIEQAVEQMASLPGIGRKTALRLVLSLVKRDEARVNRFADSFIKMKENIKFCDTCHNLSDQVQCSICSDHRRDHSTICIVEDIRDVMAIESTQQYKGVYHVLGGRISPMDGIGPSDLKLAELKTRCKMHEGIKEVILALSATMEGDTTNFYIYRLLDNEKITITTIARGVGVGTELEYADEITLGRSIMNRTPFEVSLSR